MDQHRQVGRPDWELIDPSEWNVWQEMSSATNGLVNPAMVTTYLGDVLVLAGLEDIRQDEFKKGFLKIAAGRVCDLGDGWLAKKLGIKSPAGEAGDAGSDKLQIAAALYVLTEKGIIPEEVSKKIAAQNAANAILTMVGKSRGIDMHPSFIGKVVTFTQWSDILLRVGAKVAESEGNTEWQDRLTSSAETLEKVMHKLGGVATTGYGVKALFGKPTSRPSLIGT